MKGWSGKVESEGENTLACTAFFAGRKPPSPSRGLFNVLVFPLPGSIVEVGFDLNWGLILDKIRTAGYVLLSLFYQIQLRMEK
jgi:hypothetical protein